MAITIILFLCSFLICWGPDILQGGLDCFYWDVEINNKFFEKFYDEESANTASALLYELFYEMTILNVLFDPLIFFFRMKTVRESAFALFKRQQPQISNVHEVQSRIIPGGSAMN
jgi:hypothetical protein